MARGKLNDLVGKKFGRLMVLKRVSNINNNRNARWECMCDCGNIKLILGSNLINKTTVSCGCYMKENVSKRFKKPDGFSAFNKIFINYKKNAKSRNINFLLDKKEFKVLIDQNCFYCGESASNTCVNRTDVYSYNGIDRLDNSKGYELNNVVACCKICNNAKKAMSKKEFLNWVNKIYIFIFLKENV